jgi:uncharacterized protein YbaR (Trm112 family)
MLEPKLLDILVCPKCRAKLREVASPDALICDPCGAAFPIRDGIPILLISEAKPLNAG